MFLSKCNKYDAALMAQAQKKHKPTNMTGQSAAILFREKWSSRSSLYIQAEMHFKLPPYGENLLHKSVQFHEKYGTFAHYNKTHDHQECCGIRHHATRGL
jgi:hypothetical protein